jgi:hypothetical protein
LSLSAKNAIKSLKLWCFQTMKKLPALLVKAEKLKNSFQVLRLGQVRRLPAQLQIIAQRRININVQADAAINPKLHTV